MEECSNPEENGKDFKQKTLKSIKNNINKLLWRRKSVTITQYDSTYKVSYLGNVLCGWTKGESCIDKPIKTLWSNYKQNSKPNVHMKVTITQSGLKALTKQHGLTEYWSNRITYCVQPNQYPKIFCWIYRHEGRKLKQELRCHAVLCSKEIISKKICNELNLKLSQALIEFKKDKISKQNARLSLANCVYDIPSLPRRKLLLSTGSSNYKPPLERSKSAPKLMVIEEDQEEEASDTNTIDYKKYSSYCLTQFGGTLKYTKPNNTHYNKFNSLKYNRSKSSVCQLNRNNSLDSILETNATSCEQIFSTSTQCLNQIGGETSNKTTNDLDKSDLYEENESCSNDQYKSSDIDELFEHTNELSINFHPNFDPTESITTNPNPDNVKEYETHLNPKFNLLKTSNNQGNCTGNCVKSSSSCNASQGKVCFCNGSLSSNLKIIRSNQKVSNHKLGKLIRNKSLDSILDSNNYSTNRDVHRKSWCYGEGEALTLSMVENDDCEIDETVSQIKDEHLTSEEEPIERLKDTLKLKIKDEGDIVKGIKINGQHDTPNRTTVDNEFTQTIISSENIRNKTFNVPHGKTNITNVATNDKLAKTSYNSFEHINNLIEQSVKVLNSQRNNETSQSSNENNCSLSKQSLNERKNILSNHTFINSNQQRDSIKNTRPDCTKSTQSYREAYKRMDSVSEKCSEESTELDQLKDIKKREVITNDEININKLLENNVISIDYDELSVNTEEEYDLLNEYKMKKYCHHRLPSIESGFHDQIDSDSLFETNAESTSNSSSENNSNYNSLTQGNSSSIIGNANVNLPLLEKISTNHMNSLPERKSLIQDEPRNQLRLSNIRNSSIGLKENVEAINEYVKMNNEKTFKYVNENKSNLSNLNHSLAEVDDSANENTRNKEDGMNSSQISNPMMNTIGLNNSNKVCSPLNENQNAKNVSNIKEKFENNLNSKINTLSSNNNLVVCDGFNKIPNVSTKISETPIIKEITSKPLVNTCETLNKISITENTNASESTLSRNTATNEITSKDVKTLCKNVYSIPRRSKILEKINSFNEKIESSNVKQQKPNSSSTFKLGTSLKENKLNELCSTEEEPHLNENVQNVIKDMEKERNQKEIEKVTINSLNQHFDNVDNIIQRSNEGIVTMKEENNNEKVEIVTLNCYDQTESNKQNKKDVSEVSKEHQITDTTPNHNNIIDGTEISQSVKNKIKEFNSYRKNSNQERENNENNSKKVQNSASIFHKNAIPTVSTGTKIVTITKTVRKNNINSSIPEIINAHSKTNLFSEEGSTSLKPLSNCGSLKEDSSKSETNRISQSLDYNINVNPNKEHTPNRINNRNVFTPNSESSYLYNQDHAAVNDGHTIGITNDNFIANRNQIINKLNHQKSTQSLNTINESKRDYVISNKEHNTVSNYSHIDNSSSNANQTIHRLNSTKNTSIDSHTSTDCASTKRDCNIPKKEHTASNNNHLDETIDNANETISKHNKNVNTTNVDSNASYDTNSLVKKRKELFEINRQSSVVNDNAMVKNRRLLFDTNFRMNFTNSKGCSNSLSNFGNNRGNHQNHPTDEGEDSDESGYVESQDIENHSIASNNFVQV